MNNALENRCKFILTTRIGVAAQMCAAGVILINILQMYNWTNKRFIQVVLIFYFLMQFLGYISPLPYNPYCQWALSPKFYYPIGLAMILLGIIDIWVFFFNPL